MVSTADESVDRRALWSSARAVATDARVLVLFMIATALRMPPQSSQPFDVEILQPDESARHRRKLRRRRGAAPPAPKEEAVPPPKTRSSVRRQPEEPRQGAPALERNSKTLQET